MEEIKFSAVAPSEFDSSTRIDTIAGVVLAAGTSSRFGDTNKLLADLDGEPVITQSVQPLIDSEVTPVYVVIGNEHTHLREAVESIEARPIVNESYAQGQATSVRTGIEAARQYACADAAVISLGDMPFVKSSTIDQLVAAYRSNVGDIVAAGYQEQRGNPVLFDASCFGALSTLSGDTGARHLIRESDDAVLIETGDPGVVQDIDTPADLHRLTRMESDPCR